MPICRKSLHSPSGRLILNRLEITTTPQSYLDVAEATGVSYWTVREILKDLAKQGLVHETKLGSSPYFSLSCPAGNTIATLEASDQEGGAL
jgi:DNA-binding Lrp family transcriptional regulator